MWARLPAVMVAIEQSTLSWRMRKSVSAAMSWETLPPGIGTPAALQNSRSRKVTRFTFLQAGSGGPIFHVSGGCYSRAVGTAEEKPANLYAVSDHPALAMLANGRDSLNRAFEAIKSMSLPGSDQFKGLVILVTTNLTCGHILLPLCTQPSFGPEMTMRSLTTMPGNGRGIA